MDKYTKGLIYVALAVMVAAGVIFMIGSTTMGGAKEGFHVGVIGLIIVLMATVLAGALHDDNKKSNDKGFVNE